MSWVSISFELAAAEVEALTDALLEAGAASVDVTDADAGSTAEEAQYAEAGAEAVRPWRRSRVSALLDGKADIPTLLAGACERAGCALPKYAVQPVAERDWVQATREQF